MAHDQQRQANLSGTDRWYQLGKLGGAPLRLASVFEVVHVPFRLRDGNVRDLPEVAIPVFVCGGLGLNYKKPNSRLV